MMMKTTCFYNIFFIGVIYFVSALPPFKRSAHQARDQEPFESGNFSNLPVTREGNKTKTRILNRTGFYGSYDHYDLEQQAIVFPEDPQVIFENIPGINNQPKCANGMSFCENFDGYPFDYVKETLKRKDVHNDLFGTEELPPDFVKHSNISNRFGSDEEFVCASRQKVIFPQVAQNKDLKWKYIINQDSDKYTQGVIVEVCTNPGGRCDIIGEIPGGYVTSCRQKYILRRMVALSSSGDPVPDTFLMPSACCCSYRRDHDFLSRIGIDAARTTNAKI